MESVDLTHGINLCVLCMWVGHSIIKYIISLAWTIPLLVVVVVVVVVVVDCVYQ